MKQFLGISLLIYGLFFPNFTRAANHENGTIIGKLQLKDQHGKIHPLGNTAVTLNILESQRIKTSARQISKPDGSFQFHQVDSKPQQQYQLTATYQGADFSSATKNFLPSSSASPTLQLDLLTYEVSSDLKLLRPELLHIGIYSDSSDALLQIEESIVVSNSSTQAWFSAEGIHFALPGNAKMEGEANSSSEKQPTLLLSGTILPGEQKQLAVHFKMRQIFGGLKFSQELPLLFEKIGIFLLPSSMQANGTLNDYGNRDISGTNYRVYLYNQPTSIVQFRLSNVPGGFGIAELILLSTMLVILILSLVFIRSAKPIFGSTIAISPTHQQHDYQYILQRLLILEEAYARGKILEHDYRANYKKLMDVLIEYKASSLS